MEPPAPMRFEFGRFRLDRARRSLIDDAGAAVPLAGKAFDALSYFLEHAGQVVGREALMDALWPQVLVEQNSVSQVVHAVRRALGNGYIVTIKGRGYQLVVPVTAIADDEAARGEDRKHDTAATPADSAAASYAAEPPRPAAALSNRPAAASAVASPLPGLVAASPAHEPSRHAPARPRALFLAFAALAIALLGMFAVIRTLDPAAPPTAATDASIAVLPFVNMSSVPEQEHFADGLSEELLNRLARIEGLRVIARTSSFAYKGQSPDARDVGSELGVAHVLEGSVRRSGERLRVTAQLIDAAAGHHVWSETYDRSVGDVFTIQDEIAGAVANALSVELGVRDDPRGVGGTENAEAYDLFLRALFWRNRGTPADGLRAAELLREATAEDPAYALAWAEMAWALELAAINSPNRDMLMAEAREAVDHALALAPRLWEAHRERAVLYFIDRDWAAAEQALADARKLAPAAEWPCLDALFVRVLGGDVETFVACARARRERDPLSLTASMQLLIGLYESGRYEEAYAEYERGRDLVGGRGFAELFGQLLAWKIGDAELVQTHFDRLAALYEPTPEHLARMVEVHADEDAALEAIHIAMRDPRMQQPWLQATHALWLAHYGDDRGAAEALGRAVRFPDSDAIEALWASDLAGARRLPEFKEIVRELGFVDYWRESGKWPAMCRPRGQGGDFECF